MTSGGPTLGDNLGIVILLLVVGILSGMRLQKLIWQLNRGGRGQRYERRGKVVPFQPPKEKIPDAADQLRTVMKADFKAQPLLNKSDEKHSLSGGQASTAVGCSSPSTRWCWSYGPTGR